MKARFLLLLALIPWAFIGVIYFALKHQPAAAIACGVAVALCTLGASRAYDHVQEDGLWEDARRHPRF